MSVNNFRDERNRSRASYKLWVKYKVEHVTGKLPRYKTYYSYDCRRNPQQGLNKLLLLIERRTAIIEIAILYDNASNKEIHRYYYY